MSDDKTTPQGKYVVPALAQGLQILALFGGDRHSLTAPEIAQLLKLPRTKVFRLLHTLQLMGYVRREEDERHFSLGPALLGRGFAYLASLDIVEVAQPVLQRLRDETGLSAHMALRDGNEIVYVARYPARTTVASSVNIGTRFPIHATVIGRMIVCELDDAALSAMFPKDPLPSYSEQTPTNLADLKAVLAEDRARGYAVSQSFFERGVSSVAAPVRDGAGNIVAAINITAVDAYIDPQAMNTTLKDKLLSASHEITQWLCSDLSKQLSAGVRLPGGSEKKPRKKEPVHA